MQFRAGPAQCKIAFGKEKSGSQPPVHPWQPTLPDVITISGDRDGQMTDEKLAQTLREAGMDRRTFLLPLGEKGHYPWRSLNAEG